MSNVNKITEMNFLYAVVHILNLVLYINYVSVECIIFLNLSVEMFHITPNLYFIYIQIYSCVLFSFRGIS